MARLYLSGNQGYKELYHIDGNKLNNHYQNLGWRERVSTFSMHYWWLLNAEKTPLRVRCIKTKEIQYFPSLKYASYCLNLKIPLVKRALEDQEVYQGYQFKHLDDLSLFDTSNDVLSSGKPNQHHFQVQYIPTKKVTLYTSCQSFKRETGLSEGSIMRYLDADPNIVHQGYFYIRKGHDKVKWPDDIDYRSKVVPLKGTVMVCRIDLETNEEYFYINSKHASIANKISHDLLKGILKTKTGIYENYKFTYVLN